MSSRVTRSLARSVIDSDSGNTTSAGHCSRLMATVGERCSVARAIPPAFGQPPSPRAGSVRGSSCRTWALPLVSLARISEPSPTARMSTHLIDHAIDLDRVARSQPFEDRGRVRHLVVGGRGQSVEHGVVRRGKADRVRLRRRAIGRLPPAIAQQARVGGGGIDLFDEAHHAISSFTSSAGRWHSGSGLACVCRSVPRSNLRGSCFAYSGSAIVLAVSLKSAGA